MIPSKLLLLVHLVCFLLAGSTSSHAGDIRPDDIVGVWLVQTDEEATEHIEIFQRDGLYFGKIIWAKSPDETSGPALDVKNKKDELKSRPLVGLEILKDYKFDGVDTWQDGDFYAYKKGKTASPKLTLIDADHLKIQVKILLFKKTFIWPRVAQINEETLQNPHKNDPGAPSLPSISRQPTP